MKIAIVTVHHAHNYGAMLQAYGLQQALIKTGYDAIIIDYDEIKSSLFPRLTNKSLKGILSWFFYSIKTLIKIKTIKRGYKRFETFYEHFLIKTDKYLTLSQIDLTGIDLLLVGSDQVWSMKRDGNRPYFQLDFGGEILRASYAASMGSYFSLTDNTKKAFKNSLDRFCAISVREKETSEYVELLTGKKCRIDLDPVFLLDMNEWDDIANTAHRYKLPPKYILCYELLKSNEMYKCVQRIKEIYHLPVVVLSPSIFYHQRGDKTIIDAGPVEMVDLIRNAEYVVTNSFHGTVYAILYHKLFYSVLTSHGPGRIKELLENMGLGNRIYCSGKEIDSKCDFAIANDYIKKQNLESYKYISGLKNIGDK